ncbi:MAG: DUF3570 domain-containing protein [Polyangiaceae bacterium]
MGAARHFSSWLWVAWSVVIGVVLPVPAFAAPTDAQIAASIDKAVNEDYAQAHFGEAKKAFQGALDKCKAAKCSAKTRAMAHVGLGMVASQTGAKDDAKKEFIAALKEDQSVSLPGRPTPDMKSQWKEAQEAAKPPPPPPPPPTPDPPPSKGPDTPPVATPGPSAPTPGPSAPTPGPSAPPDAPADPTPTGPPPPPGRFSGWSNEKAFQAASAALAADYAGKLDECIEKDKESLALEEQPRTRLHLASCELRLGKMVDALRDAQKAVKAAKERNDTAVLAAALKQGRELLRRIPHVTFTPPENTRDLKVIFDDKTVAVENLTQKFSVDPGKHVVHAEQTVGGVPYVFDREYDVKEADFITIPIVLGAPSVQYLTPGQLRCMLSAKNQEDVLKCVPQGGKSLVVRMGMEGAVYADSLAVQVFSPRINASITSPTAGWNVGAGYLLDVFTAASPDIVSMASTKYAEKRHAVNFGGGYKPGLYGVQGGASMSREPDYLSLSANLAVSADLNDKLITPRLSYQISSDTIGRKTLSCDACNRGFLTHQMDAGVTLVLSPTTIFLVGVTFQMERGDQSKPYRNVAMFDEATAARVTAGESPEVVNQYRLTAKPFEQLPLSRNRHALSMRIQKRFPTATARLEERLYFDSWGTKASSTDARYIMDVHKSVRAWPHLRVHFQTAADFYQLAYVARQNDADAVIDIPTFRSGDRELSPLITATGGGGIRFALTSAEAKVQLGLTVQADIAYTRFFNALYTRQRAAIYSSVGIDAEFE